MTLLQKLSSKSNLFLAWAQINKNPHSFGIDHETIQSFRDNAYQKISEINKELLSKKYKFLPYRGSILREANKKPRLLRIPAVRDRVVQKSILNILEPRFSGCFRDCCYGYIKHRRICDAVRRVLEYHATGNFFVLEADIEKFFDNVNKQRLLGIVKERFRRDTSIDQLLEDSLDAEIGNLDQLPCNEMQFLDNKEIGIPQGGVLSPLFANIYLTAFDNAILENKFNLVRYADDFIILCKTEQEAKDAYALSKKVLENGLGLKLHPIGQTPDSKTRISDFKRGFKYLGIQFNLNAIMPSAVSVNKFRNKVEELTNYHQTSSLIDNLTKLSLLINGWGNAYIFCNNGEAKQIFASLDDFILRRLSAFLKFFQFLQKADTVSNKQLQLFRIPKLMQIINR